MGILISGSKCIWFIRMCVKCIEVNEKRNA